MIEFGNRLFTGAVGAAVILAVLGSLLRDPRRRDLTNLAWGLVAGVIAQIILGALVVKTELDPRFNMGHFLLSMVLVWNAVVLLHRAGQPDEPSATFVSKQAHETGLKLRLRGRAVFALASVLLVSGTIVTGTGRHAGSDEPEVAARLPFDVREVTRIHSIIAICLLALVLLVVKQAIDADRADVRDRAVLVAAVLIVQGAIGYAQYFAGIPVLLVGIHLLLATLAWIAVVRLQLTTSAVVPAPLPAPVA